MKRKILSCVLFFTAITALAQKNTIPDYTAIDQKALQLPASATQNTSDIAAYINA